MIQEHLAKLIEYIMPNRPNLQAFFDSMYSPQNKTHSIPAEEIASVKHSPLVFNPMAFGFFINEWTISAEGITIRLSNPTHTMSVTVNWDVWRKTIFNYIILCPKQMTDEEHLRPRRGNKVANEKSLRAYIRRVNKQYNVQLQIPEQ